MSLPLAEPVQKDGFRLRGVDVSRIDAFSDVVFGFALTLLVVSLQVPRTFVELEASLHGLLPFGISFFCLMTVWHAHYKFFRRFGTHDLATIAINGMLLFVVLFYVYPLRFLFLVVSSGSSAPANAFFNGPRQVAELMMLYGFGFAAIYLLLAMLYWNGLRQHEELGLSRLERLLTQSYIAGAVGLGAIGLLSSAVAWLLPDGRAGWAGWVYLLTAAFRPLMRRFGGRRAERLTALHKLTATPQTEVSTGIQE